MPIRQIFCVGVSHQTAVIPQREQTKTILAPFAVERPAVLISTCNRVELYTVDPAVFEQAVTQIQAVQLADVSYALKGKAAARHLLRVAAGLESMVLGEAQILGQVRQSWETAVSHHTLPAPLNQLCKTAVRTGKRVRTETEIARHPSSMAAIGLQQVRHAQGSLQEKRFLVIGLGEMGRVTLKALRARGYAHIALANRTLETAVQLAQDGESVYPLGELSTALSNADILFTAVRHQKPLFSAEIVQQAMTGRNGRSLTFIDLAVPRNVETAVDDLPNCTVINVDQLQTSLDSALTARKTAVPAAETIIAQELALLESDLKSLTVTPAIKALRAKAETIRQAELKRTRKHLQGIDEQTMRHIEHLSQSLVNKLLHEPTKQLRTEAKAGRTETAVASLRVLFDLEE